MSKILPLLTGMLLLCTICTIAQTREISGRVTGQDDGSSLPGVNVVVKSTNEGTVTDSNGNFRLAVSGTNITLVFSFIGYEGQEIAVENKSVIDVAMKADITQLGEVVVVGYGTQLKQDVTGNVASVSGTAINNIPVNSFEQALQGRAAGVLVTAQNGKLGQGINVQVRGSSSISAGNQPLYVIDGMIVNSNNLSGTTSSTNPMSDINFNDIQSIEILKDASAAAIYGARASNGVVLVTTKRGQSGKTNITVGMQYGSSKPTNNRDFLNSEQYIELYREAAVNRDLASGFDPVNNPGDYPGSFLEDIEGTFDYLAGDTDWRALENNTNWEKEAFQKAGLFNFDISASGGNEKTKFYFNGGYTDQDGILIGNSFERFTGRLNLDHKVNNRLSFGTNINIARTTNNRVADDRQFSSPLQLVAQSPLTPVRDKSGILFDDDFNPAMFYYPATMELENSRFVTSVNRNIVALNAKYALTKDLSVIAEYGIDLLTQNEDRFQNSKTEVGRAVNGYGRSAWAQVFNQTSRVYLNYFKQVNLHSFDLTGGMDYQTTTIDRTRAEAQNYPLDGLTTLSSAADPILTTGSFTKEIFLSYYARANYKFNNRYLLSLSGRYDGSSKFGTDNQFGFFPAVSAGWIISEESFFNATNTLSFLKLRSSYGITGNADIGNYIAQGVFAPEAYDGSSGLSTDRIPNPDLRWEKTLQFDLGLDLAFFNDKLSVQLDYYNKQTNDLLLNREITGVTGFQQLYGNVGSLENTGIEAAVNYAIVRNEDISWKVGFNYARNRNKVLQLDGDNDIIDPSSTRFMNVVKVGQPIGVFYGAEYAGVDPANGNALWFVNEGVEGETTSIYAEAKKVVLGTPTPTTVYGFNMDLVYKGFDLSILFQGVAGNKIFNAAGAFMSANARFEDNQTIDQLRRWQNPGDITDVPQARLFRNNGAQISSRALTDGDYLRLKTITLGYSLPASLLSKISLTSARLYVTGQNLLTFTKYEGWDPEVNTDYTSDTSYFLGNDFYSAPQAKNLIVGIKVGF